MDEQFQERNSSHVAFIDRGTINRVRRGWCRDGTGEMYRKCCLHCGSLAGGQGRTPPKRTASAGCGKNDCLNTGAGFGGMPCLGHSACGLRICPKLLGDETSQLSPRSRRALMIQLSTSPRLTCTYTHGHPLMGVGTQRSGRFPETHGFEWKPWIQLDRLRPSLHIVTKSGHPSIVSVIGRPELACAGATQLY